MADTSYNQKENLENSEEAMEAQDDEEEEEEFGIWGVVYGKNEEGENHELLKLQRHATPQNLDANCPRENLGSILVDIFRKTVNNATKLSIDDIMFTVQKIVNDSDATVRSELVEQFPHIAMICQEAPHLFGDFVQTRLLGIVKEYLQDSDNQVRQGAQAAILTLIKRGLLDNNIIETEVLPTVELMSTMNHDFVTLSISLMSKMAPFIGKELTEKVFLDRYIALCEYEEFMVRRICVTHFVEFCSAIGKKAFFRKLFPVFVDLCCDKAWSVRKACVDILMPVSCCVTLQHRRLLLAEVLATHLNDDSKWVRISAYQILGPFISTFAKQFTEVTYNQYGELVFTSQQDNHFSIRYSYEGIFPTKGTIKSQTLDTDDYSSKENLSTSTMMQKQIFEEDDDEAQDDDINLSTMRACKSKIHFCNERTDDAEKYNPFLYYYIPPDLPLDDELVEAAKKAAAENNADRKSSNSTLASKVALLNDSLNEESYGSYLFAMGDEGRIDFNGQEIVPQHLIDSFLLMAHADYSVVAADMPHHCAFSFPAVVLTLGKENWSYLKKAYQTLAGANQWKVRRTLASSIHEIAIILGEELTATDLVPIYDGFIKDLDEVRIGILKHLATFLKILKPADRCQYLPRLKNFLATDNEWNWRFREELATQLLEAVNLFRPIDVEHYIMPLSLELLRDKVAAVRHVTLALVTQIVAHLSDNERLVKALFHDLRCTLVAYSNKWIQRQTYALVCAQLISSNAISGDRFSQEMLPSLLKMSSDKVPNVRLAVARTLSKNVITMGPEWLGAEQAEEVDRRLRQMRQDPDRDVRVLAGGDELPVIDITPQNKTEQQRNILF